jgi:hypothetical protein
MPPLLHLSTADAQLAEEVDLVRWAMAQGYCTHSSFSSLLGIPRSTLGMILEGRRPPRVGLLHGLRSHLDPRERLALLLEQARRDGIDPGELLLERARQEVTPVVWAAVVSFASAHHATAQLDAARPSPIRRPRRKASPVPGRQLLLLKDAA